MKGCVTCKEPKHESDFYKNPRLKDGLFSECKTCHRIRTRAWQKQNAGRVAAIAKKSRSTNPERTKAVRKAWREKNKESERHRKVGYRLKRYGLTRDEADAIITSQGSVCAICGGDPDDKRWGKLHADHDHATGMFRAFLCSRCNTVLGKIKEDVSILEAMMSYIHKHGGKKF